MMLKNWTTAARNRSRFFRRFLNGFSGIPDTRDVVYFATMVHVVIFILPRRREY